ncbi:hypothetical protein D3C85_1350070 [compost metagenome]
MLALIAARLSVALDAVRALGLGAAHVHQGVVDVADIGAGHAAEASHGLAGREGSRREDAPASLKFRRGVAQR